MPRQTQDSAIYRPDLGVAVMEYIEGKTMGFVGLDIMPLYPVIDQSATYPVIPAEVMLKIPDVSRSARGAYNRGDWEYENGLYSTKEKGWEEPIDDGERKLLDRRQPGLADLIATQRAMKIITRNQEKRIADTIFNSSNFTANAITNEWDDADNAVPIDDINTGISSFRSACGMLPDALVITWSTFQDLKNCDQIVDRLKYTFAGIDINTMNSSQLAQIFGVPQVIVAGAVYDSAAKGVVKSVTDIWSNEYAALVKISRGEDLTEPGVGRTFLWTEDSPQNPVVEEYREEKIRSDVYRVRHHVDEALMQSKDDDGTVVSNIAAACVYLFSNVTT